MTRLSEPTVYKCPSCAGFLHRSHLTFLHLDGIDRWSDGFTSGMGSYMPGPAVRCPHCPAVFWLEDVEKVAEMPRKQFPMGRLTRFFLRLTGDRRGRLRDLQTWEAIPAAWKESESAHLLKNDDLIKAISQCQPGQRDREIYLRRRLWWASNDDQRQPADKTQTQTRHALPAHATANMLRLLALLENDETEHLARGELLRQLGHFEEAKAVLRAVKPDGFYEVRASYIYRLAQKRNSKIKKI